MQHFEQQNPSQAIEYWYRFSYHSSTGITPQEKALIQQLAQANLDKGGTITDLLVKTTCELTGEQAKQVWDFIRTRPDFLEASSYDCLGNEHPRRLEAEPERELIVDLP